VDDLFKGPPLNRLHRTQGIAVGIPARNQVGTETVFWEAQEGPSQRLIGDNRVTGANTGIGRRHHHGHDQLAQIEVEDLSFLLAFHNRSHYGYDCRSFGDMPGAAPDLAEF
jgi:hypothetical protein